MTSDISIFARTVCFVVRSLQRICMMAMLTFLMTVNFVAFAQESIDAILADEHRQRQITPNKICSDEVFLRRVTLDLAGRIPTLDELADFQSRPDRNRKIEQLLASPEFNASWSEIWTANWIGYSDDNTFDRELLRQWLQDELSAETPYDGIAKKIIAANGMSTLDGNTIFLLRNQEEPTIRISRAFLGIRLDCARCHDHPFDRWKKENFEQFAKFFQGMKTRQVAEGVTELFEDVSQTKRVAPEERPRFLTNAMPRTGLWRNELAAFVTNSKPFARAYANRMWYQLLGRGIFDPPDDLSDANPPSSKRLLEYLADKAREDRFNVRSMVRLICNSQAYQRTSEVNSKSSEAVSLFAVRSIKPMTIEQSFDSAAVAIGKPLSYQSRRDFVRGTIGVSASEDFSDHLDYRETVQGLMNRLNASVKAPTSDLDQLYLRAMSRRPNDSERQLCESQNRDDVLYALLNSSEFFFVY